MQKREVKRSLMGKIGHPVYFCSPCNLEIHGNKDLDVHNETVHSISKTAPLAPLFDSGQLKRLPNCIYLIVDCRKEIAEILQLRAEESVTVGKWSIPKKLFDEYVRWSDAIDGYLLNPPERMSAYERQMRISTCTQRQMEIHRIICKMLNREYSVDDEFYSAFHGAIGEASKR